PPKMSVSSAPRKSNARSIAAPSLSRASPLRRVCQAVPALIRRAPTTPQSLVQVARYVVDAQVGWRTRVVRRIAADGDVVPRAGVEPERELPDDLRVEPDGRVRANVDVHDDGLPRAGGQRTAERRGFVQPG